jgi:hypothetical protein
MDSRSRNSNQEETNFDFYLKHDIPVEQVRSMLRHKKMDDDKIESTVSKLTDARERVKKYARKFIDKIDQHYGLHDVPSIIKKAMKYADKHELTSAERDAVVSMALRGDAGSPFTMLNQLRYSEMSKFMGIQSTAGEVLNLQAKDHKPLNEIVSLFETSRILHTDIKNQLALYRDCALEATTADYDKNRANLSVHIHPVVVALFLPKIDAIEKRMLCTNMGRIVIQRSTPYTNRHIPVWDNTIMGEMEAEWHLTLDIVNDPNSLAYFSDDTPITNMHKRFRIQIELWKNVLNLRQGRLFSIAGYDGDDGITGLLRVLSTYDWSYFDAPDMYHIQDEGTVLRKLLAVFSLRPTFAQVTTLSPRAVLGYSNFNALQRTTFLNIPVINVRLPTVFQNQTPVSLARSLSQTDFFIEHKTLVPKFRSVMYTQNLLFFYVNRRYQAVNMARLDFRVAYTSLPYQSWNVGQTAINDTEVDFKYEQKVGDQSLCLRSVVTVYRPPIAENVVGGSSAIVLPDPRNNRNVNENFYYNPLLANYMYEEGNEIRSNRPISIIARDQPDAPNSVCVKELAQQFGSVFVYSC